MSQTAANGHARGLNQAVSSGTVSAFHRLRILRGRRVMLDADRRAVALLGTGALAGALTCDLLAGLHRGEERSAVPTREELTAALLAQPASVTELDSLPGGKGLLLPPRMRAEAAGLELEEVAGALDPLLD